MSTPNPQSKPEAAFRKLHTFCSAYPLQECHQLLCRFFSYMAAGNYDSQSRLSKTRLMDYFLALERVIPALYELQENLDKPQEQAGKEGIYRDEVSSKHIYASFKRHPE